ncbi:MAG: DUF805 domain-containing protein [Aureispira sp.]
MKYFLEGFQRYAQFDGRSERPAYWYFFLFNTILSYVLLFIDIGIGTTFGADESSGILNLIYTFASLLPSIAVGVRRMHDINKSGWFVLIPFYNIYLLAQAGDVGKNRFGNDPLGGGDDNDMTEHLVSE